MFEKLFSKHMKIERMIITCGVLVFAIMSVLVYDGISIYKTSRTVLSDAPILSGSATTTLTGVPFSIQNIYRSKDKTQAMIILEGDLSNVSYIADTYKVFLLGPSAEEYSGGIYVFEDLNAICIYVADVNTFKAEKTQLIIKSQASTGTGDKNSSDDMTFLINLGANNAITCSFMDDSGLDITAMAKSAFLHGDDETIRAELVEAQADMVSKRNTIYNIRQSLSQKDIQLPALPDWMSDDTVATRESTGSDYIQTSYVFDGCADFDWEATSRLDNYAEVAGVKANTLSGYDEDDDSDGSVDTSEFSEKDVPKEWYHSDNSIIKEPTTSEASLISQYGSAVVDYHSAKLSYQQLVASLITSQDKYLKAIENYTQNVGGEVFKGIKYKN